MREGESHVGNQKRKCRSAAANNNNMRAWVRIVRQKRLLCCLCPGLDHSHWWSLFFFSLSLSLFLSLANGWMDGWTFLLLLTAFIPDPLDDVHHGRKKRDYLPFGLGGRIEAQLLPSPMRRRTNTSTDGHWNPFDASHPVLPSVVSPSHPPSLSSRFFTLSTPISCRRRTDRTDRTLVRHS